MKRAHRHSLVYVDGILLTLLVTNHGVYARTIQVRRVSQLQKAVDGSLSGDTLVLRKGVYRLKETLVIKGKTDLVIKSDGACLSGGVLIPLRRIRRASGFDKAVRQLQLKRYP